MSDGSLRIPIRGFMQTGHYEPTASDFDVVARLSGSRSTVAIHDQQRAVRLDP